MTIGELRFQLARLCEENDAASDYAACFRAPDGDRWEIDTLTVSGPATLHHGDNPSETVERVVTFQAD